VTMFLPERDHYSYSKRKLESQISSLFGGRIAEEMIFGTDAVTTGASNDIERATDIARSMVTKWGFSDKMGPLTYSEDEGEIFLGRSVTKHKEVSDDTAADIDSEVRLVIDRNYSRSRTILTEKESVLHAMAEALMKYETIGEEQLHDLMEGREPKPPADWEDDKPGSGGAATLDDEAETKPASGIGGAAEQH
jgi:cell division protease FtsH